MTDILVNSSYDWDYQKRDWDFYTDNNHGSYSYTEPGYTELFFPSLYNNSFSVNIFGENFKYKKTGEFQYVDSSGNEWTQEKYVLNGGTVTGFAVDAGSSQAYITNAAVSALSLHKLMVQGGTAVSAKIFALLCAGDDDVTLGLGNDSFASFGGDDTIHGRAGNDKIDAGTGDDLLSGGTGKDTLTGGLGSDIFVFDCKVSAANADVITDFSVQYDTISLDHHFFRALKTRGELGTDAFWASTDGKAHDASDRIIYSKSDGLLYYDADGTGDIKAVQFADLASNLKLTAADFDVF